jgi:thiol-disulfide isomerase/thioredoxin
MNKFLLLAAFILLQCSAIAKDGYTLSVKVRNNQSTEAYLAFYYAKQGSMLKKDSATLDPTTQTFNFRSDRKLIGGIYVFVFKDQSGNMEFILDNGDDFEIVFDKKDIIPSAKFIRSPANTHFYEYQKYTEEMAPKYETVEQNLARGKKTKADSIEAQKDIAKLSASISAFREEYFEKYPDELASKIFRCMWEPKILDYKDLPKKADGQIDSNYRYTHFKAHYWDKFVWNDDRIINTPIYDRKLEDYFKLVVSTPDSFNKEANRILSNNEDAKDMYKYSLWWLTRQTENSKVMGMDESFVYIVENYYMKGKAFWLKDSMLEKYYKRARQISPSTLGNPAANLKVADINGNIMSFGDEYIKHDYTLVTFWSSDCGHCKREVPAIDSIVRTLLPKYNIGIIGFHTEDVGEKWRSFVRDHKLTDDLWRHVHDPSGLSNYFSYFDVRATPDMYIVDRNGLIVGKHVDDKKIESLLQFIENKKTKNNQK